MTLCSAHRSFEGFDDRGHLLLYNRFTPDQRSTIASTRYCERVTAPADISKVLIKFLLRLCSYTIYSVVKYRPAPAYAGHAAWAAMSHLCFHNRFARDGAKIVELTCSMLGVNRCHD
jgi:hypothetical protein